MNRTALLRRLTYLIFFIFLLNMAAGEFHWYSSLWWFDMPMHFLGGVFLGLGLVWLLRLEKKPFPRAFWIILLGVLALGVAWELFELVFDNYVAGMPFLWLDTLSDLSYDLAGGLFAYFFYCYTYIL